MSYSRHAAALDQFRAPAAPRRSPTGYHAAAAPGAAMVHPVEQFAGAFPANANRAQRPPRHWISLLDEEQVGAAVRAVLEETICRPALLGRTPPRYEPIDRFLIICSWLLSRLPCFLFRLLVRSFRLLLFFSVRLRATRKGAVFCLSFFAS
jgi:hypothetical protein